MIIKSWEDRTMKTREEALAVLKQYNESDALLRHGYAV